MKFVNVSISSLGIFGQLIIYQRKKFNCAKFINLSISALGVEDKESATFLKMLEDMHVEKTFTKYLIKRIINIAIRSIYYIFCCRNKEWTKPDLLKCHQISYLYIGVHGLYYNIG